MSLPAEGGKQVAIADWLIRKGVLADLRRRVIKQSGVVSSLWRKLDTAKAKNPDVRQRLISEIREAQGKQFELSLMRDAATEYGPKQPVIRLT